MTLYNSAQWLFVAATCLIAFVPGNLGKPVQESLQFPYTVKLSEKYKVDWTFDSTDITFRLHVNTPGWIGFGISPDGKMFPSDVVVGWVDSQGKGFLHDRHTRGYYMPLMDTSGDWTLVSSSEDEGVTTLTVTRKLDTCDEVYDIKIENGTSRLIWTFDDHDPEDNNPLKITRKTQENAGSRSILLLNPPPLFKRLEDAIAIDRNNIEMRMKDFNVPPNEITRACSWLKLPDKIDNQHMIGWKPITEKGHRNLAVKSILYACDDEIEDKYTKKPYKCNDETLPRKLQSSCSKEMLIVWATGATGFDYPKDVGQVVGGSNTKRYLKIETHYDSEGKTEGYTDNFGFRLYLTSERRQHSAGILELGVRKDKNFVIPPKYGDILYRGFCNKTCLKEYMHHTSDLKEIHVVGGLFHANPITTAITTRLFRDDKELPPILEEKNYDHTYQESRLLLKERTVKTGDLIVTDCHFNSKKRETPFRGADPRNEACSAYVIYYPKMSISACQSSMEWDDPERFHTEKWTSETMQKTKIKNWCYGLETVEDIKSQPSLNEYAPYEPPHCPVK